MTYVQQITSFQLLPFKLMNYRAQSPQFQ